MRYFIAILVPLFVTGCPNRPSGTANREVVVFRFARIQWTQTVQPPASFSDRDAARLARGKWLFADGHFREARDCLAPLKTSKEYAADAYLFHGVAEANLGSESRALQDLQQAIAKSPKEPIYRVARVWLLCRGKRFREAEAEAQRAAEITNDTEVWKTLHEVRELRRAHTFLMWVIAVVVSVCVGFVTLLIAVGVAKRNRNPQSASLASSKSPANTAESAASILPHSLKPLHTRRAPMKVCAVIISGAAPGENVKELELHPGVTVSRALHALGLGDGYVLSREGSGHGFAAEEDLYTQVEDGQKLRATPVAEVGG